MTLKKLLQRGAVNNYEDLVTRILASKLTPELRHIPSLIESGIRELNIMQGFSLKCYLNYLALSKTLPVLSLTNQDNTE